MNVECSMTDPLVSCPSKHRYIPSNVNGWWYFIGSLLTYFYLFPRRYMPFVKPSSIMVINVLKLSADHIILYSFYNNKSSIIINILIGHLITLNRFKLKFIIIKTLWNLLSNESLKILISCWNCMEEKIMENLHFNGMF